MDSFQSVYGKKCVPLFYNVIMVKNVSERNKTTERFLFKLYNI